MHERKVFMEELYGYRADLLAALEEVINELVNQASLLPEKSWHQAMLPIGHTPHYLLFHLRELEEQVFAAQVPRILAETIPTIPVFDDEGWMEKHYCTGESPVAILEMLSDLRQHELTWLRNLPIAAWSRLARHPWWGLHTLQWWVELQADYSYQHLNQLSSIIDM
jgi:DinB superfamily